MVVKITLTGCSVDSNFQNLDGAHAGYSDKAGEYNSGELLSTSDVCAGVTDGSNSVWSTARCCCANSGYELECKQIWGPMSETYKDGISNIACSNGYFLSGCV